MLSIIALFAILLLVLLLPFLVKKVEENLEIFLFAMGALAVTVSSQWAWPLVEEGLVEPIKITAAVLVAGVLFRFLRPAARAAVNKAMAGSRPQGLLPPPRRRAGPRLERDHGHHRRPPARRGDRLHEARSQGRDRIVVVACFAIGMGAVLTPLGEPLATIVIAKLRGEPYNASFWFLFTEFWRYVVPGVVGFGVLAAIIVKKGGPDDGLREDRAEGFGDVFLRTAKTYLFVMALVFLGTGFKPIIDAYISKLPAIGLFWLNSISAILDNATLAAAEVGTTMTRPQLAYALLGLIIAGGILIPGNIPNIISAGKLKIKSREWMAVGLPIGAVAMAVYFVALLVFGA